MKEEERKAMSRDYEVAVEQLEKGIKNYVKTMDLCAKLKAATEEHWTGERYYFAANAYTSCMVVRVWSLEGGAAGERRLLKFIRTQLGIGRVTRAFSEYDGAFSWGASFDIEGSTVYFSMPIKPPAHCKLVSKQRSETYFEADCTPEKK